jgi:dTMP kinase
MVHGRLIVFDGVEGAGKSTQLDRLAAHLERAGIRHRCFREPGGTVLGDEIRRVLLDPASRISARSEALLFMASRAELVARELRPGLAAGTIILLDRFFLSTYAYQAAGRGLPLGDVAAANRLATDGLVPDLTIVLRLDAAEGLARAARRGAHDRMEQAGQDFLHRVAHAFDEALDAAWQRQHPEVGPVQGLDASGTEDAVFARLLACVSPLMPAPVAASVR